MRTYLNFWLNKGYITPNKYAWDAHVLFQTKKDGSLRLYVDFSLNKFNTKNNYLLLIFDELADQLSWAKKFSKIKLRTIYGQIVIK